MMHKKPYQSSYIATLIFTSSSVFIITTGGPPDGQDNQQQNGLRIPMVIVYGTAALGVVLVVSIVVFLYVRKGKRKRTGKMNRKNKTVHRTP